MQQHKVYLRDILLHHKSVEFKIMIKLKSIFSLSVLDKKQFNHKCKHILVFKAVTANSVVCFNARAASHRTAGELWVAVTIFV